MLWANELREKVTSPQPWNLTLTGYLNKRQVLRLHIVSPWQEYLAFSFSPLKIKHYEFLKKLTVIRRIYRIYSFVKI